MKTLLRRLGEPSTWAAMAAFFAGVGVFGWTESQWLEVFSVLTMIAGIFGFGLPEKAQTVVVRQPRV